MAVLFVISSFELWVVVVAMFVKLFSVLELLLESRDKFAADRDGVEEAEKEF